MNRLTRPDISISPDTDKDLFFDQQLFISNISDKFLELILNGPTLNSVPKDALRSMIRQLYTRLKMYEDTGVLPENLTYYDELALSKATPIRSCSPCCSAGDERGDLMAEWIILFRKTSRSQERMVVMPTDEKLFAWIQKNGNECYQVRIIKDGGETK